jgi:two-component system sensor histidine kinase VicK
MRGVRNFYLNEFYDSMQEVFSSREMADDLRSAADSSANPEEAAADMAEIIWAYSGKLGINSGTRNYYILDSDTGEYITGSGSADSIGTMTANIITAIGGSDGYSSDPGEDYMDVALPIKGEVGSYIVYIRDNKDTVQNLNDQLLSIILKALAVGLVISVLLGLFLAKTMIAPIQDLTLAVKKVAAGDFSEKLENDSKDEIGVLTRTFNDMAGRLEDTLDDLTKSEQMRREFVANVSHELRKP